MESPGGNGQVSSGGEAAGNSALSESLQLELDIGCVQRQVESLTQVLRALLNRQGRFRAGGEGEASVVRVLVDLVDTGWTVLPDRRWPGTRRANIDVILVGPGGVFVIDVKAWREFRVEHGQLWRGQTPADDAAQKLLDQAEAVQRVLADVGLAPAEVVPVLVLAGRRRATASLGAIQIVGELDLGVDLLRRGARLTAEQLEQVLAALADACPPMTGPKGAPPPSPAPSSRSASGRPEPLLELDEAWAALVEAAAADPIEAWMTWLHPSQARLVTRSWSGPARIRGAAGTGKTVVALHRARHLAQRHRRVLFASFVNTLGPVFSALFTRLAPDLGARVDFLSTHQVAARLLRGAGSTPTIDNDRLETCYNRAWATTRKDGVLEGLGHPRQYWRDEIAHVIKGRGVTTWDAYSALTRIGRRASLQPVHREAVWRLYECYEGLRTEQGLLDWEDMLAAALTAVRRGEVRPEWDAVIVDEVQDLTGLGLQLLHAVAGDRADGLLMVGDGQQSVYPGGFTLAEIGISVTGRAVVLDRNYRNRADIFRLALGELGQDTFDDLDPTPSTGSRDVETVRPGGLIMQTDTKDVASQEAALLAHLADLVDVNDARLGDIALLVATNLAARRWRDVLVEQGTPAILLTDYDGHPVDAVKVGTMERAKGLDFAHVLIPDRDQIPSPRGTHESDDAYHERHVLERRRLYVAMTRARDSLWLGTTHHETPVDPPG